MQDNVVHQFVRSVQRFVAEITCWQLKINMDTAFQLRMFNVSGWLILYSLSQMLYNCHYVPFGNNVTVRGHY